MGSHIPVLIVGAGPTGLLMACELARRGIAFRIIDIKAERTLTANAVGIQPRTLELLDNLGLAHQFLKLGQACKAAHLHADGKDLARISFEHLDSFYHFILALPQSETERLLNAHLVEQGHTVERPLEFSALTHEDNRPLSCTLTSLDSNQQEILSCDWLLACDGANSRVRELCQIPFPGDDLSEQFIVANTDMSSFLSNSELHVFFNKGTLLLAIPLGAQHYRISVNLHQSPRKFLGEKEVKEMIQERSQGDYDVNAVSWISPFWIHSKIVKNLRHGPIFLAGDAAHVHSPAGAQGMNTGLQDAYNLAWKLAMVIQGQAPQTLLDSYQAERYPLLSGIVKYTETFTKIALHENPIVLKLRPWFFKVLNHFPLLAKKFSQRLTQLSLRYKNSAVIDYSSSLGRQAPQPGERIPDVWINQTNRLHTYLRLPEHKLLLFTGLGASEKTLEKITTLQQQLALHYSKTIHVFIIADKKWAGLEPLLVDERKALHQRFQAQGAACYLIRPDNYLAYCSKSLDFTRLQTFLKRYILENDLV